MTRHLHCAACGRATPALTRIAELLANGYIEQALCRPCLRAARRDDARVIDFVDEVCG